MKGKRTFNRGWLRNLAVGYLLCSTAAMFFAVGCGRKQTEPPPPLRVAEAVEQTSASCMACHAEIFAAWSPSDHARANRLTGDVPEAEAAMAAFPKEAGDEPAPEADMILGHLPLWQPLVPHPGGRWQAHELAFDPEKQEWFNVFGDEVRHEGEWGHWTGRGMNWNSMCAHCHMTGYQKDYHLLTDTYQSRWVEQGIGCIQCHGPVKPGHGITDLTATPDSPFHGDRQLMMQTCAPCHARNEILTTDFQPGDNYHDHYRVTLPVEPGLYHPDGQQQDEVFNWTSVLLSRMGHAGVSCLDCHDPHTNQTILPVTNNALCLQCHSAPGREQPNGVRATVIDPLVHSRHEANSPGNQCISCHMPTTTYMERAPRHDHGWLKPDPLMTRELGIPNACNQCHTDQTVDWAIEHADAWYGPKLDSRQRARARAVAAAQAGEAGAVQPLLELHSTEDIPAWRATYLLLMATLDPLDGNVVAAARSALQADDPLERSAAVRTLSDHAPSRELLRPLLQDPVRLVRLDAAWIFSTELAPDSAERKELDEYLAISADQPGGRFRIGQDLANRGLLAEAARELQTAGEWDPYSPAIHEVHGLILSNLGRRVEAAGKLYQAAGLQPDDAPSAMRAGLAFAEAGRLAEAEAALRMAVQRNPDFDRAWYNLGLLLAQGERLEEAAEALRTAETLVPWIPDYPYALATVLVRRGERSLAIDAARRALAVDSSHGSSRQLLRQLGVQ